MENNSFFGRNGTLSQILGVANDIQAMKSNNAFDRVQGMSRLGGTINSIVDFVRSLLMS